ncbi:MAG: bifunctional 4-hydroxy-2-oxoglutarate aldolase/2-dehydro-3-deoxy-phosphogluconate aldolase [Saccharofermentanales bacterium]|jgi:2-dehydro-3-deoxyphosphogluconate aldolase/(4S)-4-hydroxy-2-oxoglutarate aldolase
MMDLLKKLEDGGLLPIINIGDVTTAEKIAETIHRTQCKFMEITLRDPQALECIQTLAAKKYDLVLGAGTVYTAEECEAAVKAGAQFIVTPCVNDEAISWCVERDIPIIPGCLTASEIYHAYSLGATYIKIFPAEVMGGAKMLKALRGPLKKLNIKFVPTGGINADNFLEYAKLDMVAAVGGSWLCSSKSVATGDFKTIQKNIDDAMLQWKGVRESL